VNGRYHRHVHVAGTLSQQLGSFLLAARRHRIDIEIVRIPAQMRRDRDSRVHAGGGGNRGYDHIRITHRVPGGGSDADAHILACRFQRFAGAVRKQDIPGGNMVNAGAAQAGSDGLAGLAKTDERNARCVAAGHR
jgi:hypothetical protein